MTDHVHTAHRDDDRAPTQLFGSLGFRFVHRFLWLTLAAVCALCAAGFSLAWRLQGRVTVRAEGVVEPQRRCIVKSRLDAVVEEVRVREGDLVQRGQVLLMLSARDLRDRLKRVEQELVLRAAEASRLEGQIGQERRELEAAADVRRLEVSGAEASLDRVRREQKLYSEAARAGWRRAPLDELLPVREATSRLGLARAQLELSDRRLQANQARVADVEVARQRWAQIDADRVLLGDALERAVVRSPVAGVVLTRDLDLRLGDQVRVGEGLLELSVDAAWRARVLVRQIDRPKLAVGQPARVFVEAFPHLEYGAVEGRVSRVAGQSQPGSAAYPVEIALDSTALTLSDGMVAEARVQVGGGRLLELVWQRLLRGLGNLSTVDLRQVRS